MTSALSDDNTPDLKVDESPISPLERRNSLEKHLQTRPNPQELKDRHILLNSNAAPYDSLDFFSYFCSPINQSSPSGPARARTSAGERQPQKES